MTMDPDATLAEIRRLRDKYLQRPDTWQTADVDFLFNYIMELDGWLTRGGHLPHAWEPAHETTAVRRVTHY